MDEPLAGAATVLLDTCALIYFAEGLEMAADAVARIEAAVLAAGVLVSPVSAWEIGLLSRPSRPRPLRLDPTPHAWFEKAMAAPGFRPAPFDWEIALRSSSLPEFANNDPADRLLVATALKLEVPIITRDRLILDYAAAGTISVIPC